MRISPITTLELLPQDSALQGPFWATVKKAGGWEAHPMLIEEGGQRFTLLVLVRRIVGPFTLAYVPFGPSAPLIEQLEALSLSLSSMLGVYAIRWDLGWKQVLPPLNGLIACRQSIQPEATIRIPLDGGYEQVRTAYRKRARRAISRSQGEGVQIRLWAGEPAFFDAFYCLYRETAERAGFFPRGRAYLRSLIRTVKTERGSLLLALHNEEVVGGAIILFGVKEAIYLVGGSQRERSLSPSYALQDEAIRLACEAGCHIYDLYGVAGPGGRGAHLASLGLFKRSFGGEEVTRPPSADFVLKPVVWRLFRCGEYLRNLKLRYVDSRCSGRPTA
jgi:lipid II:glycine glycyltransferase (peptidoglycan interpeptide bridge formation enzyme)